jgi:thiol-activated cytolysin
MSACLSVKAQSPEIDRFVRSMQYDIRKLLTAREDGSTETMPARRRTDSSVIVCTNNRVSASNDVDELSILAPTAGTIFPGALVRVNQALAEGRPQAITLPRSSVRVTLDLPGASNALQVDEAIPSKVQAAVERGVSRWLDAAEQKGFVAQARSTYRVEHASTREQLAVNLGVNARWLGNQITSDLSTDSIRKQTTSFALYRQIYYTATIDPPRSPSLVFASQVSLDDVRSAIGPEGPPGIVRSVHYGRIILVRMDSQESEDQASADATLKYAMDPSTTVDAETKNRYERIAKSSRFAVLVFGGSAKDASTLIRPDGLEALQAVIQSGARLDRANRGLPIAYTVTLLRDEEVARINFATDFVQNTCTTRPNAFVRLRHDGAYVARFHIAWREHNDQGQLVNKSWESGNRTAGWHQTIPFPGDAEQIEISANAASGLVWDPWPEAMRLTLNGPANQCFRVFGTTLNRRWERLYDDDCAR